MFYLIKKIFKYLLIFLGVIIILIFIRRLNGDSQFTDNILPENKQISIDSGDYSFVIMHQGIERKYLVHVPLNYNETNSIPAIIILHGGGGNMEESIKYFNLNPKADKEGFLAIYPEGYGKDLDGKHLGTWNAGKCCAPATDKNIDDVGFIDKVIEKVKKDFHIDGNRIYSVGFSNGAQMSYRLGCELSNKIAAVVLGGSVGTFEGCSPSRPIPTYMFSGTEDGCTPYEGGEACGGCVGRFFNSIGISIDENIYQCSSVDAFTTKIATKNNCLKEPSITYDKDSTTCVTYSSCTNNAEVTSCKISGGGHVWPGKDQYSLDICSKRPNGYVCNQWKKALGPLITDFNVNDQIWKFLKKYKL